MKKFVAILACAMLALPFASPALAQTPLPDDTKPLPPAEKSAATTDGIIVKFRAPDQTPSAETPQASGTAQALGVTVMDAMSAAAGVALAYERPMSGEAHVLRLPNAVTQSEAQAMADNIAQLPEVEYASPVIHMQAMQVGPAGADLTPNDPQYSAQWHYFAPSSGSYGINLPAAWAITTGSASVVVAVLDTGIRFDHPDLAGRTLAGYDFVSNPTYINDGDPRDGDASDPGDACPPSTRSSWHGTHVAGTIGAASNNGIGVAGVNWVSKILPLRVLGKCGNDDPDIIDAVRWAAGIHVDGVPDNATPARVINLSLGGNGSCTTAWQSAINDVLAKGVVVVAAAGNSNANAASATPANCNGVISVAATLRNGKRASYSNYGSTVKIAAPGGICASNCTTTDVDGILSTYNAGTTTPGANTYNYLDGTSMATPHVAGVAALMFSVNPNLSPAQVLGIMQSTATAFPGGACDSSASKTCGAGIVNAGGAVILAKGMLNVVPRAYFPFVSFRTALQTTNDLLNGNFEAGPLNWQPASAANPSDTLIYQYNVPPLGTRVTPHSGDWVAWMGGYAAGVSEDASLRQSVTVPAGKPYLVYYQIIYGGETNCANDYVRVLVDDSEVTGSRVGVCNAPTYGIWAKRSVNLSAFAGKTVTIAFAFHVDSSTHSPPGSVFIDDVSLSATP